MATSVNSTLVMPAESDWTRALRMFTGMANSIVGSDQNLNGEDPYASSQAGQYVVANPDGSYATMGVARSNLQTPLQPTAAGFSIMPLLLIGGAIYFLVAKK
ncbi:hypothetical protein [Limnohabitans sp.]|uniref:hypothetical protein n=1 Tax=Limnohabitans sp. TaxID=1907725 RepID=UPI00286F5D99|nr:hypothetical protein [Limnohabitans sp.]